MSPMELKRKIRILDGFIIEYEITLNFIHPQQNERRFLEYLLIFAHFCMY
jgi:hypothetical protein